MIIQLDPPLPLVTPKGKGYAHFLIDYSQEHHLMWVVFLDDGGECWTFENKAVIMDANATLGRVKTSLAESHAETIETFKRAR